MKKLFILLSLFCSLTSSLTTSGQEAVEFKSIQQIMDNEVLQRVSMSTVLLDKNDSLAGRLHKVPISSKPIRGKYGDLYKISTTMQGNYYNGFPYVATNEFEYDICPMIQISGPSISVHSYELSSPFYDEYLSEHKRKLMSTLTLDQVYDASPFFIYYNGEYLFKPYWNRYSKQKVKTIYNNLFPTRNIIGWLYDGDLIIFYKTRYKGIFSINMYYAPSLLEFLNDIKPGYKSSCLIEDLRAVRLWLEGIPSIQIEKDSTIGQYIDLVKSKYSGVKCFPMYLYRNGEYTLLPPLDEY